LHLDGAWVTGHTAGEREVRLPGSRQIRPARGADAEALFALACRLAASFVPERAAFDLSLRRILADPSAWLGVAEEEGAVFAYCLGFDHFTFYGNGRVAWVEEIAVRADSRRRGAGAALMAAFEDWARSRGARLVALATRRAAPFYTALGYEESATYFRKLL
jgi:GNAT superfamily N-acetyltransferase